MKSKSKGNVILISEKFEDFANNYPYSDIYDVIEDTGDQNDKD